MISVRKLNETEKLIRETSSMKVLIDNVKLLKSTKKDFNIHSVLDLSTPKNFELTGYVNQPLSTILNEMREHLLIKGQLIKLNCYSLINYSSKPEYVIKEDDSINIFPCINGSNNVDDYLKLL